MIDFKLFRKDINFSSSLKAEKNNNIYNIDLNILILYYWFKIFQYFTLRNYIKPYTVCTAFDFSHIYSNIIPLQYPLTWCNSGKCPHFKWEYIGSLRRENNFCLSEANSWVVRMINHLHVKRSDYITASKSTKKYPKY